jgi:hypothetical protein
MDRDQANSAWRKAWLNYQRKEGIETLRQIVREQEPPKPPELVIDPETALWWRTLAPPPLQSLDQFADPIRRQEATMEHQEAIRVLAYIQETQDSRIAVNGRRLSPMQGAAVRDALTMFIESQAKETTNGEARDIHAPRREDRRRENGGRGVHAQQPAL